MLGMCTSFSCSIVRLIQNHSMDDRIFDVTKTEQKPAGARRTQPALQSVMKQFQPGADLATPARLVRALLAGFAVGLRGYSPSRSPPATQISEITAPDQRTLAVVLFAVVAVQFHRCCRRHRNGSIPTRRSGIKDGYERVMKVHGRFWITAALLLSAALVDRPQRVGEVPRGEDPTRDRPARVHSSARTAHAPGPTRWN